MLDEVDAVLTADPTVDYPAEEPSDSVAGATSSYPPTGKPLGERPPAAGTPEGPDPEDAKPPK